MLRTGRSPVITADYQLVTLDGPDIYGTVERRGWRVRWSVRAGWNGEELSAGRTLTRGGAWVKAVAAAHRPYGTGRTR
jgi:hypothetical protein